MSVKPVEKNIYIDTESGIYIIRKFKKGKEPLWESTGETSIKAARSMKDDIIARWIGDRPKSKRKAFNDLFDDVIAIKKTKSWKTAKSAEDQISNLRPWFQEHCPFLDQWNEATWEKYILYQREHKPKRRLKHDREILIFTLNLARKKGLLTQVYTLRKSDSRREIGKYYEDSEIRALLKHSPTDNLKFQILIAIKMGMRLSEILHLSWDRVDLKTGIITLYSEHTKTRQKRFVPIHGDLLAEFKTRWADKDSIFLFPNPHDSTRPVGNNYSAWCTAREKSGVTGRFHDLRHRAMTDMLAGGLSDTDVSKITGASPEVIRRIYHHLRRDVLDKVRSLNCGKFVEKSKK